MTGKELAAAVASAGIPMNRAVLANLESGRRDLVTVDELYAFAEMLGTSPAWLADCDGPMCTTCRDVPPGGFTCLACGASCELATELIPTAETTA